ncbi:MAG: hypothetical protein KF765_12170 [Parvibaculaceae bacterium]|nr:hypothetical protein [Parvibaculaceae bacterium]
MIESKIEPGRILLRDAEGETVFDTNVAKVAVLSMFTGTWANDERHAPASGYDTWHTIDHDLGAAPLGAQFILGWITLQDGSRQEFSGTVVLAEAWWRNTVEFFGGQPVYPRTTAARHMLTPLIHSGRIVLREQWFLHGCIAGSSPLRNWPCNLWLLSRSWDYDLRVCAFVGGT